MRSLLTALTASLMFTVAAQAADKWWPSKWGADDELGSFNMLGPELTLKASKLITSGKTYRLGIETNKDTPAFKPRSFEVRILMPNQYDGEAYGENKFGYADDIIAGWIGVGSQLDGLGHANQGGIYYNGKQAKDFVRVDGVTMFGIENIPPVVAPGVLIDMAACLGQDILKEGTAYTREMIIDCEQKQGVSIEEGDVVLFNSGWMNVLDSDPKRFGEVEPGVGISGAEYLVEKNVLAVGADTWGVETHPPENPNIVYHVHQILMTYNGIYLLENMDTRELAKDKAHRFMFVLGPARLSGTVQSIINPIAIR